MRKLVVAGGDARDRQVAILALKAGWAVWSWGFALDAMEELTAPDSYPEGAVLLGPVAGIDEDGHIATANGCLHVSCDILRRIGSGGWVAAGKLSAPMVACARSLGIQTLSYLQAEEFAWQNAVLTAEGAIGEAIGASGYGLYARPMVVLGYGRVGSVLSHRLRRLDAEVRVLDADAVHRAQARSFGMAVHDIDPACASGADLVFNTIPYPVITRDWERVLMDTVVFELASPPGGVAPEVDRSKVSVRPLPGIPGRVAPKRAAQIIWETVWPIGSRIDTREEQGNERPG